MQKIKDWVLYLWLLCRSLITKAFSRSAAPVETEDGGRTWREFLTELLRTAVTTTGKFFKSSFMVKLYVLSLVGALGVGAFVAGHRIGGKPVRALKAEVEMQAESIVDLNKTVAVLQGKLKEALEKPPAKPAAVAPPAPPPKRKTFFAPKKKAPEKTASTFPF